MSQNQKKIEKSPPVGFNKNPQIKGLETFKKNLEKHFFSKVTIRNSSTNNASVKLIIGLNCNFSMVETLYHFNKGNWGNFECENNSFANSIKLLQQCNTIHIETEELSFFFKDTSIIINTLYDQSIPEQLENILKQIGNHYVYFTNGLTKIPYEIHIPVFEENVIEDNSLVLTVDSSTLNKNDFFSFWGLYFYSEEDAVIYDLETLEVISGKLQMLNRE